MLAPLLVFIGEVRFARSLDVKLVDGPSALQADLSALLLQLGQSQILYIHRECRQCVNEG